MLKKLGHAGLLALSLYGCTPTNPQEGAVLALVTLEPRARASCLVIEASEPGGAVLKDGRLEVGDKREYKVAVVRGALPAEVGLRARSYWGKGCADPLLPVAASDEVLTGFPLGTINTVALNIAAPPAADDRDGDGFADQAKGGLDCNDDDSAVNPAADERCTGLIDTNCNGLSGCADPACTGKTCAQPAAALAFATPKLTLKAGACSSAVTIEVRSAGGIAAAVPADTRVGLSAAPAAGFGFFSDAACATAIDSVTLAAGSSQASLYVKGGAAGDVVVSAAAIGFTGASQIETITSSDATKLAFWTPARSVVAGGCSSAITLESQDVFGNGVVLPTYTAVTLTASLPTGVGLFRQPDCTGVVTTFGINAGEKRATFYFTGTVKGPVTLTAASASLASAQQDEAVTEAPATALAFATPPRSAPAGDCSGVIVLETRDPFGNPSAVAGGATINLTGTPSGSFTYYTDATCTGAAVNPVSIPPGQSSVSLHFKGTIATVAAPGTLAANAGGFPPISQDATVTPGPAQGLGFVTGAQGIDAGQCSGIVTVSSRDQFGNASPTAATLNLSANPSSGFEFFTDPGCSPGSKVTSVGLTAGTASFYFKATAPVAHTLTVQATGLGSADQVETINVGQAAKLVFTSGAQTRVAGECSAVVTLQTQDIAGNPSNVLADTTVSLVPSPATQFLFYANATCTGTPITQATVLANSASATFYFQGKSAGQVDVTASTTAGLAQATQRETIDVDIPSALVFTSAPQSLTAGVCSALATLEVHDQFGNVSPVALGATVSLTAAPGSGLRFFSNADCSTEVFDTSIALNGRTASFYFSGTLVGTPSMNASATGLGSVPQGVTINAAPPASLSFATAAQNVQVSGCSGLVTLQLKDPFGNAATANPALAVTLSATPSGALTFYPLAGCGGTAGNLVTIAQNAGTVSFSFKANTVAQTVTLTASSSLPDATQDETISPKPPTVLAFITSPLSIRAGECASATVEARDVYGNPSPVGSGGSTVTLSAAPSAGFAFNSDPACAPATGTSTAAIAPDGTRATFYFSGTVPSGITVTADAAGVGAKDLAVTVTPGLAKVVEFVNPAIRQTATLCAGPLSLRTRDLYGNVAPVSALATLNLTATPPAGIVFYSDAACTVNSTTVTVAANGSVSSLFYFLAASPGTPKVTATDLAATLGFVSQTETVTAGPTTLAFTSAAQTLRAGVCSAAVTLETRDSGGQATNVAAATPVTLDPALVGISYYADPACTAAYDPTIAAGTSGTTFYYRGVTGGTYTLTATTSFDSTTLPSNVIIPAVQTGTCTIATGSTSVSCAIPTALSALSHSFFVFQATTSADTAPSRSYVRCRLQDVSTIACTRVSNSGSASPAVINWQTADLPGITVQHLTQACGTDQTGTLSVTINPVVEAETFVLYSSESGDGTRNGSDFHTVRLADATHVEITQSLTGATACNNNAIHSLQVVDMPGVTVTRGNLAMATGAISALPTVASGVFASSALLYSWRTTPGNNAQCRSMLRGAVTSATALSFTRGDSNAGCGGDPIDDIQWERIEFPSPVQQFNSAMANGGPTAAAVPTTVDLTRTVVFTGGQIASGQSAGEGSTGSAILGAITARLKLNSSTALGLRRDDTSGTALFTSFVVQLDP